MGKGGKEGVNSHCFDLFVVLFEIRPSNAVLSLLLLASFCIRPLVGSVGQYPTPALQVDRHNEEMKMLRT